MASYDPLQCKHFLLICVYQGTDMQWQCCRFSSLMFNSIPGNFTAVHFTHTDFLSGEKERKREIQLLLTANNTQQHSTLCIAYYYVQQEKNKLQEAQHGRTAPTKCTSSSKRIDIPSQNGGGVELHSFVQCVMTRYRLLPRHSHRTASWHINLCTCFATGQHWVECYAGKTTISNRAK